MPSGFSLVRKKTGEEVHSSKIDVELSLICNKEPHPEMYLWGWDEAILARLEKGASLDELRKEFNKLLEDPRIDSDEQGTLLVRRWVSIVGYLETTFDVRRK